MAMGDAATVVGAGAMTTKRTRAMGAVAAPVGIAIAMPPGPSVRVVMAARDRREMVALWDQVEVRSMTTKKVTLVALEVAGLAAVVVAALAATVVAAVVEPPEPTIMIAYA
jgi:hypothetical protein